MTVTPASLTTTLGDEGLGQQPWWVEQWMELINSYRYKKRLERAWTYARSGNVLSIRFEGRRVHARVQGTEEEPYKVKLWLDTLSDEDWGYVLEALGQKARWSAQLLAGIMPADIERAFAASGRRLFPFKLQEVRSECTCPDKANPCKHTSAVYYLMGDRFSEDPFVLFQLRGRSRNQLLANLAEQRRQLLSAKATAPAAPHPPHPAITDPGRWWRYDAPSIPIWWWSPRPWRATPGSTRRAICPWPPNPASPRPTSCSSSGCGSREPCWASRRWHRPWGWLRPPG